MSTPASARASGTSAPRMPSIAHLCARWCNAGESASQRAATTGVVKCDRCTRHEIQSRTARRAWRGGARGSPSDLAPPGRVTGPAGRIWRIWAGKVHTEQSGRSVSPLEMHSMQSNMERHDGCVGAGRAPSGPERAHCCAPVVPGKLSRQVRGRGERQRAPDCWARGSEEGAGGSDGGPLFLLRGGLGLRIDGADGGKLRTPRADLRAAAMRRYAA